MVTPVWCCVVWCGCQARTCRCCSCFAACGLQPPCKLHPAYLQCNHNHAVPYIWLKTSIHHGCVCTRR